MACLWAGISRVVYGIGSRLMIEADLRRGAPTN